MLNFSRVNNSSTTYHALPDAWQKQFGYNDLYDDVFDMATSMRVGMCFYNTGVNDSDLSSLYVIWSWCGDYWTLGAGSEIGLYKYTRTVSGNNHFDAVNFNIPMSLNSYIVSYDVNNTIEPLFHWYPNEPQWWITGFDCSHHDVNAYQIHNIGYLDFSENPNVFESIKKSEFNDNNTYLNESNRLFPNLIFDDIDYYVWLIW